MAFARELLAGLKREHGGLWVRGRVRSPDEGAFVQAVDALGAALASHEGMLAFLADKPPAEALPVLGAVDPAAIVAEADAVRALAAKLRPRQAAVAPGAGPGRVAGPGAPPRPGAPPLPARPGAPGPRPGPQPTPARQAAGQVLGLLKRWTAPAEVERLPAPEPPRETPAQAALAKARQAFDAAHKLAGEILAYVSPRLHVVKVGLDATGLPGKRRPMAEIKKTLHADAVAAGVPEPQLPFLPPLVRLFDMDADAVRRVHPALVQWAEVKDLAAEAGLLQGALRAAAPDRASALLTAFETGRYRAAIYPLTHLHLTFKGLPIVAELFPPPGT